MRNLIGWDIDSISSDKRPRDLRGRFLTSRLLRGSTDQYSIALCRSAATTAPCVACSLPMADQRIARGILVANFIPGFVLCTVHGAITRNEVPAVGTVPLFFSSGLGLYLFASGRLRSHAQKRPLLGRPDDIGDAQIGPDSDEEELSSPVVHPFWIFLADAILAAALMIVLVFTWIEVPRRWGGGTGGAMLAAYGTVPLLVNL